MTTPSGRKRVVIVGAGFGGLEAAKVLGSRDEGSRVEVTVVDRLNYFLFQPLLYQVALAGLAALTTVFVSLLPGGLSSARARAATAPAGATGRAAG